jgi:hypothetical protein
VSPWLAVFVLLSPHIPLHHHLIRLLYYNANLFASYVVINGQTSKLSIGTVPALIIGGTTYAATIGPSGAYVFGGQTLLPGQQIVFNGHTISLAANGQTVVIDGSTSFLNTPTTTLPPLLTIGGKVYTANSGTTYIIDGLTLTPGGFIVRSTAIWSLIHANNDVSGRSRYNNLAISTRDRSSHQWQDYCPFPCHECTEFCLGRGHINYKVQDTNWAFEHRRNGNIYQEGRCTFHVDQSRSHFRCFTTFAFWCTMCLDVINCVFALPLYHDFDDIWRTNYFGNWKLAMEQPPSSHGIYLQLSSGDLALHTSDGVIFRVMAIESRPPGQLWHGHWKSV